MALTLAAGAPATGARPGLARPAGLLALGAAGLLALAAAAPGREAAAGLLAAWRPAPPPAAAPAAKPRPALAPIPRPLALYNLEAPELARLPFRLEAFRRGADDGREDRLTWGAPDAADEPFLLVAVLRGDAAGAEGPGLVVEAARRAAGLGASVARAAAPGAMDTKFGEAEAGDLILAAGGEARPCLAFRRADGAAGFAVLGLHCGTPARPADRAALACLLDRLDLTAAGGDLVLRALFVEADRHRREGCRPAPVLAPGRPREADRAWLAPGSDLPALRGGGAYSNAPGDAPPRPRRERKAPPRVAPAST